VNLTILPTMTPPPYAEYRSAIIESGVKIVETADARPKEHVEHFKAHGVIVIHKCTSVRHALSAQRIGVDGISIDGFECAGHPGEDDVAGLVLIPATVDKVTIPVIASGGFADGRGLAAALALGAEGKQFLVDNDERGTNLIFRKLHNTARVGRNSVSDEVVKILSRPEATFTDVAHELLETGNLDAGLVWAGQSQGLIRDIPAVAELVERIVQDASRIIERDLRALLRLAPT
jgi:NADH:quinone reductase (non-electrogenic)